MPNTAFLTDVYGPFGPDAIRLVWHPEHEPDDPQVELLKAAWPLHVEAVTRQGGVLYNGSMVGYLSHRLESGTLVIETRPTDYATYYCTNYLNHALGERIGWSRFANPIGVSTNVITQDGWLLYGRRGDQVATHPGTVHTIGGTIEPNDRNATGTMDPFVAMVRELNEELRLREGESIELLCLGMIHDVQTRQPELVFDARLAVPRAELEMRLTPDDQEHAALLACPDRADAFRTWLLQTPRIVPVALGALCLHARRTVCEAFSAELASIHHH